MPQEVYLGLQSLRTNQIFFREHRISNVMLRSKPLRPVKHGRVPDSQARRRAQTIETIYLL